MLQCSKKFYQLFFFKFLVFLTVSAYRGVLFSCALVYTCTIFSRFNSWVTGAMGIKFLSQGSNSSRIPQLGIEPGTLRLSGRCPNALLLLPSNFEGGKSRVSRCLQILREAVADRRVSGHLPESKA